MKSKLISQAAYAKLRGVHPSAVTRAVRAGRITLVDGKVDPVAADAQWKANSRARVGSRPSQAAAPTVEAADSDAPDYALARARREEAEACLAEDRLRIQRGELVVVAELRKELAKHMITARDAYLALPARMAPVVFGKSIHQIQTLLDAEIRHTMNTLAEGLAVDLH